jgi:hypothetical protein
MFILKNFKIEGKRTCSIVLKSILKRSEHVYIKEFKYRSEANRFVSSKIYFEAERTCFILKILNIEAKRSKLILKCESSEAKRAGLFRIFTISKGSEQVR